VHRIPLSCSLSVSKLHSKGLPSHESSNFADQWLAVCIHILKVPHSNLDSYLEGACFHVIDFSQKLPEWQYNTWICHDRFLIWPSKFIRHNLSKGLTPHNLSSSGMSFSKPRNKIAFRTVEQAVHIQYITSTIQNTNIYNQPSKTKQKISDNHHNIKQNLQDINPWSLCCLYSTTSRYDSAIRKHFKSQLTF
jgi:hypothetical protein